MKLPTFLVIGAAKAGTTALYHYLGQHPEIFVPSLKEPNFFGLDGTPRFTGPGDDATINRFSTAAWEEYLALFEPAKHEKALGEVSPLYLYAPGGAQRIREAIPEVKLICVLRNPVERAFSSFLHLVRDGREPLRDFAAALAAEEERRNQGWEHIWHYREMGYYGRQLERYLALFDRSQIRIFLYEELVSDAAGVLRQIFSFLEVEPDFLPETLTARYNVSYLPRSPLLHQLIESQGRWKRILRRLLPSSLLASLYDLGKAWNRDTIPFPDRVRQDLLAGYQEDLEQLQRLIGRDLSHWRKG